MNEAPFAALESLAATGPRQAALLVHAMSAPDREWLLGHLEPAMRPRLEGMLAELRSLGVPSDAGFIREVLDAGDAPAVADALPLDSIPSDVLHALLSSEPDALAVRVLSRVGEAQKKAVLKRFDASKRTALQQAITEPPNKAAPSTCLLDREIDTRMRARARAMTTGPTTGHRMSWRRFVRHWHQAGRAIATSALRGATP